MNEAAPHVDSPLRSRRVVADHPHEQHARLLAPLLSCETRCRERFAELFTGPAHVGWLPLVAALLLGGVSYGFSIVLNAYALRLLGAAREAAYFATARKRHDPRSSIHPALGAEAPPSGGRLTTKSISWPC